MRDKSNTKVRKTLITGAGGSIGKLLIEEMIKQGLPLRAMVRNANSLLKYSTLPGVEIVEADLTRPDTLDAAVDGVENIIHLAGYADNMSNVKNNRNVNVFGTKYLLQKAIKYKIRRIVMASSNNVYGKQSKRIERGLEPVTEKSPTNTRTAYGLSKLAAEKILLENDQVEAVILRPGVVLGEVKVGTAQLGKAILKGLPIYLKNGGATINYIDVRNLLDMLILALEKKGAAGEIYNAVDTTTTFQIVADRFASELGGKARGINAHPFFVEKMTNILEVVDDIFNNSFPVIGTAINAGKYATTRSIVSSDKARKKDGLGWKPNRTFEDTMDASGRYLRQVFAIENKIKK